MQKRAVVKSMKQLFNRTVSLFLCYKYITEELIIKLYSSDINTYVYGSDHNRANHLLRNMDGGDK